MVDGGTAVDRGGGVDSVVVVDSGGGKVLTYAIVDTAQAACYGDKAKMSCPAKGAAYFGQDSQYVGSAGPWP